MLDPDLESHLDADFDLDPNPDPGPGPNLDPHILKGAKRCTVRKSFFVRQNIRCGQ